MKEGERVYLVGFRNRKGAGAMAAVEARTEQQAARIALAQRKAQGFVGWRVVWVRPE
jgi:hypothetical protein